MDIEQIKRQVLSENASKGGKKSIEAQREKYGDKYSEEMKRRASLPRKKLSTANKFAK